MCFLICLELNISYLVFRRFLDREVQFFVISINLCGGPQNHVTMFSKSTTNSNFDIGKSKSCNLSPVTCLL